MSQEVFDGVLVAAHAGLVLAELIEAFILGMPVRHTNGELP